MKAGWKLFWASIVVLAVAFGLARWLVPDVVPIGYSEEAQASWAVLTAFVLRAIELTGSMGGDDLLHPDGRDVGDRAAEPR